MQQILRLWWPILAAIGLVQTGNGITGTLVSVSAEAHALAPWLKGLILSAFYVGSLVGALAAPPVIARASHIAPFAGFTLLLVASTAGFAVIDDPYGWILLRFAAGFGISGMFAVAESWLNLATANEWRARVFSIYIMVQLVGLAAGQLLLNARGWGNELLFLGATAFTVLALACMRFESVTNPTFDPPQKMSLKALAKRSPFGVAGVTLAGFAWAALMASGPALVELIGLSDAAKSLFMVAAIVSGMLAQFPVGSLADRMDRRHVLAAMAFGATGATLAGMMSLELWALVLFAVVFGASTFPLYAVGVARINERLMQAERTSASAAMIVFFLIGAIIAPPLLSYAVALGGPHVYFAVVAIPHATFAVLALVVMRNRVVQTS